MDWLREVFWGLGAIIAYVTVGPVSLGGVGLALACRQLPSGWARRAALAGIVALQAFASSVTCVPGGLSGVSIVLLPVYISYPYLNLSLLLFLWVPVGLQLLYVSRSARPGYIKAALIGFGAVAAGVIFLLVVGGLIGAETD